MARALFSIALFLSAALLFILELMVAKMLLPSLGGVAAVWNTCLVFFQMTLLAGYWYAHVTSRSLPARAQVALHVGLLVAAAVALPIGIRGAGELPVVSNPIPWLIGTLGLSVGLPFFALSSTTPLVQSWFVRATHSAVDPYILYSASNLGSFVGLLSYPIVAERALDLHAQSRVWSGGYAVVALVIVACGAFVWRASAAQAIAAAEPLDEAGAPPARSDRLLWVALAFVPASLTLSVTTYISIDIAAVPLVWILPLSLYLLSLVVAFARPEAGRLMRFALPIAVVPPILAFITNTTRPAWLQVPVHLVTFFIVSLACHQALARSRPGRGRLSEFYLWLALGGAAGGVFTAIVAPLVFPTAAEYPIGLLLACLAGSRHDGASRTLTWLDPVAPVLTGAILVALITLANSRNWAASPLPMLSMILGPPLIVAALFWARPLRYALALGGILAASFVAERGGTTLRIDRTFFGVHRVLIGEFGDYVVLMNGGTVHGLQALRPVRRRECLAYYSRIGPAGQVFESLGGTRTPRDVAVLGLGAGTLACYAAAGQRWTFFEIDPAVASIARTPGYFTYLADAPAQVGIVIGDARLSLTHLSTQSYDVIVLDVFSSDAVPVHLLTREALQVYLGHLAPGGLLLFHISNKYFDLRPIVAALAGDARLVALAERHTTDEATIGQGIYPSEWVVMGRDAHDLGALVHDARWELTRPGDASPWTDQYSNLVSAVRWHR